MNAPINNRYYNPQEPYPRYPLELSKNHHINLWSDNGEYKWAIAIFIFDNDEGPDLRFIGDRPFDNRVNWKHFEELARHGQLLADNEYFKNGKRD